MKLHRVVPRPAVFWVAVTVAVGAYAFAGRASVPQETVAAATAGEKWLEFDMPPDSAKFTGLIVGYFEPGAKAPAFAFEVTRARVETPKPGVARIPLVVGNLRSGQTYAIRLRTVVGKNRSPWSEPSGTFVAPDSVSVARAIGAAVLPEEADRKAGAVRERPASAAPNELQKNRALADRVRAAFPGIDPVQECDGFRNARDCITALYVASNLKVPFADVKKVTADVRNRNVGRAIQKLKPDADARAEAQKAQEQSRKLARPNARPKK